MKSFVILALLTMPLVALASPEHYQVTTKIFVDNKLVGSPRITALVGQEAKISQGSDKSTEKVNLKVVATDDSNTADIRINLYAAYESESKFISGKQEALLVPGKETTITLPSTSNYPNGKLMLKVVATRQ